MELAWQDLAPYAEVHETHTGLVVLVADKAYKAKKSVTTKFLDFSTTESRECACAREVLLNSRLAPEAYLGIAHFNDASGDAAEPVVVMRRYPRSRRLTALLESGDIARGELTKISELLARFHVRAPHSRAIDLQAAPDAIGARWHACLTDLRELNDAAAQVDMIDAVELAAMKYIAGRSTLFADRIRDKRIIDGHGDLLADDIFCMENGPVLLDCLEFDDRLRYIDGIDDAAFLAMDLEFLGRSDLAEYFLDAYSYSANDHAPVSLRHFYIAYRSLVRARVDGVRVGQGNADAVRDASRHLALARDHLASGTVRLVLIGGGPGTGKTTLAHALADRVDAEVISTDEVRRRLQQCGTIDGATGVLGAGLYAAANVEAVYRETLSQAKELLSRGHSVILDATWREPRHRRLAEQLATETISEVLEIVCWASVDTAASRIRTRSPGASDAAPVHARELALRDDAWDTAHLIDTAQALPDCVDQAEKLWWGVCRHSPLDLTRGRHDLNTRSAACGSGWERCIPVCPEAHRNDEILCTERCFDPVLGEQRTTTNVPASPTVRT